jgi:hypothetical protein
MEWRYSSNHSSLRQQVEVAVQLHAPAPLKTDPVHIEQVAGWAPGPARALWSTEK